MLTSSSRQIMIYMFCSALTWKEPPPWLSNSYCLSFRNFIHLWVKQKITCRYGGSWWDVIRRGRDAAVQTATCCTDGRSARVARCIGWRWAPCHRMRDYRAKRVQHLSAFRCHILLKVAARMAWRWVHLARHGYPHAALWKDPGCTSGSHVFACSQEVPNGGQIKTFSK